MVFQTAPSNIPWTFSENRGSVKQAQALKVEVSHRDDGHKKDRGQSRNTAGKVQTGIKQFNSDDKPGKFSKNKLKNS
jgi:hypothetical protein